MSYKQDIIRLREQEKTYDEIKEELGCSKGTISYHCRQEGLENIGRKNSPVFDEKKEKIQQLREEGKTVLEVSKKLDVSQSTVIKYSDIEKKEAPKKVDSSSNKEEYVGSKKHKGALAESKVKTRFTELGYVVLEPTVKQKYDIVVSDGSEFYTIQIKHAREHKKHSIKFSLTWTYSSRTKYHNYAYDENDIDYFSAWSPKTDEVYIVSSSIKNKNDITLRVDEDTINQHGKIRLAKNYTLDEKVKL